MIFLPDQFSLRIGRVPTEPKGVVRRESGHRLSVFSLELVFRQVPAPSFRVSEGGWFVPLLEANSAGFVNPMRTAAVGQYDERRPGAGMVI